MAVPPVANETPARLEGKRMAKIICFLLGMGQLMSWNSILTIGDYYYNVFPDYHPSRVLTVVYQPFALGTIVFLTWKEASIDTRKRVIFGFVLFALSTICCILLDVGTSGKGGVGPYVCLCVLVAAFGVANGLVEGGVVGDLSFMLPEFVQSFFVGVAATGVLTSCLRLVTKAAFDKYHDGLRKGAIMFLAISAGFELLCAILYMWYFPKLPIIKYYRQKAASEGSRTVVADLAAAGINQVAVPEEVEDRLTTKQLFEKNWVYLLDIYLTYALTLLISPGFLYENTGKHSLGDWYPLVLIATFNLLDVVGRYTPFLGFVRLESPKGLTTAVLARFIFIPAFYVTARYAREGWMIMLVGLLGLTNGHLTVCLMTVAPLGYKGPEQNAIGNLMVVFLLGGIFCGVCLDWLWIIGNGTF